MTDCLLTRSWRELERHCWPLADDKRYLLARYNVTWHRFRALDHPLRIGEVMVLPITGEQLSLAPLTTSILSRRSTRLQS